MVKTPKLGKRLGRKPDAPDGRDFVLSAEQAITLRNTGAPLPVRTDAFGGLGLPVYDQGELGSCTANSGVLYRRFLAQKFSLYSASDQDLSRLFLYYQERKLPWNDDVNSDAGAAVRDVFYVLAHVGVCPEAEDPYLPTDFTSAVANNNAQALTEASRFRLGAYHRVPDVLTARHVLASGYAIILGFVVYESFEEIGADGHLPMPRAGEAILGGHAVVIRGYDDQRSAFHIQNSWGPGWADHGCFWMPYAYLEDAMMSQPDMWIGHLGRPWRPDPSQQTD
ncbi:MAG: C1 family peptidase [Terriglobia bacterium]